MPVVYVMVSRESLTKLFGLLMVLGVFGALPGAALPFDACGSGTGMIGVNPVQNGAMTIGSESEPTAEGVLGETVQGLGLNQTRAYLGAAGWTIGLGDGSALPRSAAGWSDSHGTSNSGAAWVHYDAADAANGSVVIRQVLGDAAVGGVFCDADEVTLDVVSDGPVDVTVSMYTAESDTPFTAAAVRVGQDGGHGNPGMPTGSPFKAPWAQAAIFDLNAVGTLTLLEIRIDDVGDGSSHGAWVFVDNVAAFGTSAVPVPL